MALVRFTRRQPRLAFQSIPAFDEMENRMRKMVDDLLTTGFGPDGGETAIGWMPAMQITENAKSLEVTAELPGLEKKDVDISVSDDGMLTISGEKTEEKTEGSEDSKYHLWERSFGSFRRSFTLPRTVDASKIIAEFKNGVLKVSMPKTDDAQAKGRKIAIEAK